MFLRFSLGALPFRVRARVKLHTLPDIEVLNGVRMDLRRRSTQLIIRNAVLDGHVWCVHCGTPRTVFSRARHNVRNMKAAFQKELTGIELAFFTAELCEVVHRSGVFFSSDNPATSRLWDFYPITSLGCPGWHFHCDFSDVHVRCGLQGTYKYHD